MQNNKSISDAVSNIVERVKLQMIPRGFQAAQQLCNATQIVLSGSRSGRVYRIPNTGQSYTASAPGESPAVRTGMFRASFQPYVMTENGEGLTVHSQAKSNLSVGGYVLGTLLEDGTERMASRPYTEKIKQMARPQIEQIFRAPYK